jgi:hypothetical protein
MPDCERQRIDKPMIYSAFWNAYLAGYLPYRAYRTKELDGPSGLNCFVHFIEPSSLGDDKASSEFRPNRRRIAFLQNLVTLEYEMTFSWSTATSSWWMAFFERPFSRRKGQHSSAPFGPFSPI